MSFADSKPRTATGEDLAARWGGAAPGKRFRCYLCGHKFVLGDVWRWVPGRRTINFLVCGDCDGPSVVDRWVEHVEDSKRRFWWLVQDGG